MDDSDPQPMLKELIRRLESIEKRLDRIDGGSPAPGPEDRPVAGACP